MHELGIVIQVVKQVEDFAKQNDVKKIKKLVLEIGELSGVVPHYIEDVYPMAVENSTLKNTKLQINILPGLGSCKSCGFGYNLFQSDNTCPLCDSNDYEVISGTDFNIKEIHAE